MPGGATERLHNTCFTLSLPLSDWLKTDLESMPGHLGEAGERACGGLATAAFEPRDRALRCLHAPRDFGLAQPRAPARLCHRRRERKLVLEQVVLPAVVRILHPRLVKILDPRHRTSLARDATRLSQKS